MFNTLGRSGRRQQVGEGNAPLDLPVDAIFRLVFCKAVYKLHFRFFCFRKSLFLDPLRQCKVFLPTTVPLEFPFELSYLIKVPTVTLTICFPRWSVFPRGIKGSGFYLPNLLGK